MSEAYPLATPENLHRYRERTRAERLSIETLTDPPWLGEAFGVFRKHAFTGGFGHGTIQAGVRAVLAFAARQPRLITEAKIEAARRAIHKVTIGTVSKETAERLARAALEAAEKAI